jgi:uncharacterized protein (TIGR03067 family)
MIRLAAFAILVGLASLAHAEVIELEGTIKSIDQDARAIAITRKTPKGEKVLELEVAKNAGDISGFKEGDKISFAYNPDAEIVTKIEKGLSEDAAADLKAMEGEWKNVFTEEGGKKLEPGEVRRINRTLFIKGDVLRMERVLNDKFGFHEGRFRLDPEKHFFDLEEPGGLTWTGIYELKGDSLKLCYRVFKKGTPPKERPTEFNGVGEKAPLNYEYKRVQE